jgi:hypothetical protein
MSRANSPAARRLTLLLLCCASALGGPASGFAQLAEDPAAEEQAVDNVENRLINKLEGEVQEAGAEVEDSLKGEARRDVKAIERDLGPRPAPSAADTSVPSASPSMNQVEEELNQLDREADGLAGGGKGL